MIPVILVGAPNSGKTSLFNWLTGAKFKTVNYPGATVESAIGTSLPVYGSPFRVFDTPGLYSMTADAPDERITLEVLREYPRRRIILVMDATQIERHLLLAYQLKSLGASFVVALSMGDSLAVGNPVNVEELQRRLEVPVFVIDGRSGRGIKDLGKHLSGLPEPSAHVLEPRELVKHLRTHADQARQTADQVGQVRVIPGKWDRWLLHSALSLPLFFSVMALLFTSVFYFAAPFMDLIDSGFASTSSSVGAILGDNLFGRFVTSGLIEGAGAVLVFVPQIFILFFLIGVMEETGYLARASTLIDRPLHLVGLSGRSFVPILSGFACAIPAIMATRNLKSPRERWIAVFILPLMTCSARLPVYALLLGFLFFGEPAWKPGLALAAIYFGSLFVGSLAALVLHKILREKSPAHFLMELPPYRLPKFKGILRAAGRRSFSYVRKAGPTIFVFVLVLWGLTHLPYNAQWSESEQLANSYLGRAGHAIEPVFKPMGLDWRAGVSLGAAFVAREVFVSAMVLIFNLSDVDESSVQDSLLAQMKTATFSDGALVFTPASVIAMIVYFMIALQCLTTTAVTVREMNSWRYGVAQLVVLNLLAYVFAVLTYQILS